MQRGWHSQPVSPKASTSCCEVDKSTFLFLNDDIAMHEPNRKDERELSRVEHVAHTKKQKKAECVVALWVSE